MLCYSLYPHHTFYLRGNNGKTSQNIKQKRNNMQKF